MKSEKYVTLGGALAFALAFSSVQAEPVATTGVPASVYVQDGLIAQWDGIENAGAGLHDAAATSWKDLIGSRNGTLSGKTAWNDSALTITSKDASADRGLVTFDGTLNAAHTIEVRAKVVSAVTYGRITGESTFPSLCSSSYFWIVGYGGDYNTGVSLPTSLTNTLSWTQSGVKADGFNSFVNGVRKQTSRAIGSVSTGSKTAYLGNRPSDYARGVNADYNSLRIYSRVLTDVELAYNYAVDRIRFEGVAAADALPTGYRLNAAGNGIEYCCTVTAGEHGKVSVNGSEPVAATNVWTAVNGPAVTFTPMPDAGYKFLGWRDDASLVEMGDAYSVTFASSVPKTIGCVFKDAAQAGIERFWTGKGDGASWSDGANWCPVGEPAEGDEVLIENGTVSLTNVTPELLSCRLSGSSAKMLFAEPVRCAPADLVTVLKARYVTLENGASMSHVTNLQTHAEFMAMATPTWLMDGRVNIECETLEIDATSKIDVGGRGYYVKSGTKVPAPGPGGDNGVAASTDVSPSYGGWSGYTGRFVAAAATKWKSVPYGTPEAPVYPGTAGGFGNTKDNPGSPGGGAVRIKATGRVTLNGTISANGGTEGSSGAIGASAKSGTGGAVWISCKTVAGSGLITANSGTVDLSQGGIGSGGRIALVYDADAQDALDALNGVPTLRFQAQSRPTTGSGKLRSLGRPGTVYFPDARFLGYTFSAARGVQFGEICCADWTGWNPTESLTLDNAVIVFREGPALTLNLSGALTVTGENAELDIGGGGGFLMNNKSSLSAGVPRMWSAAPLALSFGSVSLGEKSYLEIYAGPTNETSAVRNEVTIVGALDLAANAQLLLTCHPTNAAVTRVSASSLNVAAGATITSDGWGWPGAYYGMGPGAPGTTSYGASYGGAASLFNASYCDRCHPYGSPDEPILLGSGGALSYSENYGSSGGGVVWLNIAGDAVVNGTLSAGGQSQLGGSSGSGSGGSVYLQCRTLSGSGTLSAKGGYGQTQSAAGAGGRIAVKYDAEAQAAVGKPSITYTTAVTAGDSASKRVASDFGSVYFTDATLLGNCFMPKGGVTAGSVFLGSGWENWHPQGLTVSNAYVRLPCGTTPITIDGDVLVTGDSEFGIGGGDYAYTNSVRRYAFTKGPGPLVRINGNLVVTNLATSTDVKRSEFWVLAGDQCGTDARTGVGYGGLLEVTKTIAVCASNSQLRAMSHPNDGWSVKVTAHDFKLCNGGGINVAGCGCQGAAATNVRGGGPGGGRGSGSGGGYGGAGGGSSEAAQGPACGYYRLPLMCGSGAGWYSAQGSLQYPGAGGGLVWLEVAGKAYLDGTVNANGCNPSGDHNGGGSGGGICIRCRSWATGPNVKLTANGGSRNTNSNSGYGGGGGRIAVLRNADLDPTPVDERTYLSVDAGASKSSSAYMPQPGTIHWQRTGGMRVILR